MFALLLSVTEALERAGPSIGRTIVDILLLRHAEAEDESPQGDSARRLTRRGRETARRVSLGLRARMPRISVLAASPYARARQTADVLAREYGALDPEACAVLAPGGSAADTLRWIRRHASAEVVVLVGHEPDLGRLASYLLAGCRRSFLPLRKSGACLVRFEAAPVAGRGVLLWRLDPEDLMVRHRAGKAR